MFDNTTFCELLKLIPRSKVKSLVEAYQSDRYKKKLKTWDHIAVLLIAQLTGARSLRDLETTINNQQISRYHTGLTLIRISRSTLSDANQHMNPELLRDLAKHLMSSNKKYKTELGALLTILDSSPLPVSGRGSQWAELRSYSQIWCLRSGGILLVL